VAAHRKRPLPCTRMADLLVERKRQLLAEGVELTRAHFEQAWREAWEIMVQERAWPHATEHRRQWRSAMLACKGEMRAAFLDRPTMFARVSEALAAAGERMDVRVRVEDLPRVFLGAIREYGATLPDEHERDEAERLEAVAA